MDKIGDILRDARIEKKLSFDDVVEKTGIAPHYLLAMELDQLKLLPEGKTNEYLEKYARAVGLDPVTIIHGYRNQEVSEELILPSSVEESSTTETKDNSKNDTAEKKGQEVSQELSIDLDVTQNIETPSLHESEDKPKLEQTEQKERVVETLPSRLSKYDDEEEISKKFPWALLLLVLLALAIVSYVGYVVYNQLQTDSDKTEQTTSAKKTSKTTEDTRSTTTQSQMGIETDFANGGNNVTLSNTNGKVDITFTLTGDEESWISATNTTEGESGTTLTADNKTYTTTLAEGSTTSMLTVSIPKGVEITINGQKLDTSSLADGLTNINLTVQ